MFLSFYCRSTGGTSETDCSPDKFITTTTVSGTLRPRRRTLNAPVHQGTREDPELKIRLLDDQ